MVKYWESSSTVRAFSPCTGAELSPQVQAPARDIWRCVCLVGVERRGLGKLLADLLPAQRGSAGCPVVPLWPAHPQWWLRLRPAPNRPRNRCVSLFHYPEAPPPPSWQPSQLSHWGGFWEGGFCSRKLQMVSGQGQAGRGETHTRQACLQAVCLKPRLARRVHSGPLPTCPEDRVPRLSQPQAVELDRGGFLINF